MPATLYYAVLSSGSANVIAAYRAGILGSKLTAQQVDITTKTILSGPDAGKDYFAVNSRGNVPAIVLENGDCLTENSATLQWIVDNAVTSVGPKIGTQERLALQTKLSYISSELHGVIHDLFNPATTDPVRKYLTDKLKLKLQYVNDQELADGRAYWIGNEYTVADSYLYFVLAFYRIHWNRNLPVPDPQDLPGRLERFTFIKEAHSLMEAQTNPETVTLYYNPLSSGIANVDLASKRVLTGPLKGSDYLPINPKGNVPALVFSDGTVVNQNAATLQWILDNAQGQCLGPANGIEERYVLQSKLSYTSSELHGVLHDLFSPATSVEAKAYLLAKLKVKLQFLNDVEFRDGRKYWVGMEFSVADAYLYFILFAIGLVGLELAEFKNLKVYFEALNDLDFVQEALAFVAQHKA
ncbi:hypothetical protein BDR26DRAFT_1007504 [Obelidium mucronatum]|nr:hypothetical protein BDR26DRAFT_1007504 [Obelidium mucronatum]